MTGSRPEAADASAEELVHRAAAGDLAAFARIVRLHNEEMTRVAFVITGDLDSAVRATEAAWPLAWDGLGRRRPPDALGPWLCSLVATEAVMVAMCDSADGTAGPAGRPDERAEAGLALDVVMDRLDPGDRALLALRHIAGLSLDELARAKRRSRSSVAARLERATAAVAGPQPLGTDPGVVEREVAYRLLAYAGVRVRPVDADAVARRARTGEQFDGTRVVSVAISLVAGALVAGLPYLAMLFHRR